MKHALHVLGDLLTFKQGGSQPNDAETGLPVTIPGKCKIFPNAALDINEH